MPPLTLVSFLKPICFRAAMALRLRTPDLQWTTMSSAVSNSCARFCSSLSGKRRAPGMRAISNSFGSRTSTSVNLSFRSKRAFSSLTVMSDMVASGDFSFPRPTPQNWS
jgi:hypothetical protein